jgi:flagellar hook-associated protein FlgK
MIGAISNALQGLMTSSQSADKAAERIANATNPDYGDTVELSEEAVRLKTAEISYKANLASIKTAQDMSDELMRLFDEKV